MADISMKELLEAGVHFGHQTRRWNPKMKKYIFGSRNGIYIIDLQKTMKLFRESSEFVSGIASKGKTVLFVGTKRQAQEAIEAVGEYDIPYVSQRWLGGTLTNFHTIKKSIDKLNRLDDMLDHDDLDDLTKKERYGLERERNKLLKLFKGIRELNGLPDALFVIDPKREKIAVQEARIMNIPVIAIVDTNCDPDVIDYVIPGNDDAIRAINLFVSKMVQSIQEGRQMVGADVHPQEQAEAELEAEADVAAAKKPEPKAAPVEVKKEAPKAEAPKKEEKPEPKVEQKAEPKTEPKVEKKAEPKTEKKADVKAEEKAEPKAEKKAEVKKTEEKAKPEAKKEKAEKKAEKTEEKPKAKSTAKKTAAKKSTTKKETKDAEEKPKAAAKKTTKKKDEEAEPAKKSTKAKSTTKAKTEKKTESAAEKKADTAKKKSATAKKED